MFLFNIQQISIGSYELLNVGLMKNLMRGTYLEIYFEVPRAQNTISSNYFINR